MLFLTIYCFACLCEQLSPGSCSHLELAGSIPRLPLLLFSKLTFPRTPFCTSLREMKYCLLRWLVILYSNIQII